LETLKDAPAAKGMNIRQMMMDFYHQYYSANLMKLAVYGKESLDVLEQWVSEKFSIVPNKDLAVSHFPSDPFRVGVQTQKVIEFVPVRDIKNLELIFPIPAVQDLYLAKPTEYLSHLIGHESEGSILSALKKKLWANGLSSYLFQTNRDFAFFSANIELSDEGVQHIDDIISCVFAYIGMLKKVGHQEWIYTELKEIAEMKFKFLDKKEPSSYVTRLANNMQIFAPEHVISGSYLFHENKPDLVDQFLAHFRPDNCVIIVNHKGLDSTATSVEKWYKTKYNLKEFDVNCVNEWIDELQGKSADFSIWSKEVHLPKPNPFIPTDFTLYTKENGPEYPILLSKSARTEITVQPLSESKKDTPVVESAESGKVTIDAEMQGSASSEASEDNDEEEEDGGEDDEGEEGGSGGGADSDEMNALIRENLLGVSTLSWCKPDTNWKKPKLNVVLSLENGFSTNNPWNIAMADLFILMLKELLNEYSYYADCSGLFYSVRLQRAGLEFLFRGYHHKLPVLIERVCQEMKNLSEGKEMAKYESMYALMKEKLLRNYKNTLFLQPYYHCILGSLLCLEDPRYSNLEKYEILNSPSNTIQDLLVWLRSFLLQLKYETFINGNFDHNNDNIVLKTLIDEKICRILHAAPLPFGQQLLRRSVDVFSYSKLTKVHEFIYRQSAMTYNKAELNSACENIYFIGVTPTIEDVNSNNNNNEVNLMKTLGGELVYEKDLLLQEALVQLLVQMVKDFFLSLLFLHFLILFV
jgi:secreted Zn-dependent insulinase-like peptidase